MKLEHSRTHSCDAYLVCNDFGRKRELQFDMTIWGDDDPGDKNDSKWTFSKTSDTGLLDSGFSPSAMKQLAVNDVYTFYCEIEHEEPIGEFDD